MTWRALSIGCYHECSTGGHEPLRGVRVIEENRQVVTHDVATQVEIEGNV
jgi:hypothetical protein